MMPDNTIGLVLGLFLIAVFFVAIINFGGAW